MKKNKLFWLFTGLLLTFSLSNEAFSQNIVTNGNFEDGINGWTTVINGSEVGSTLEIDENSPLEGTKSILLDHPAEGKKGMWRINLRTGLTLKEGFTYDFRAKVKVETNYPDGKRLGVVTKENQDILGYYWTQKSGTQDIKKTFYWNALSADSITLQWQLGYAGEDIGLTGTAEAFKVWIDEVQVIERATVQPTGISLESPLMGLIQGQQVNLSVNMEPSDADPLVKWESDNQDVATVEDGIVTAVGGGEVNITATSMVNDDIESSIKLMVYPDIITNGGFESGMEGWVASINGSEVGTTIDVTGENVISGDTTLLYDHPAEGKKGMWRIALRKGMALDSGMTYDVSAKVKVETTYPDGKRLGVVAKENQGLFSYYWTQPTGTQDIKQSFYWGAMSEDSITLQFQLGYAGEDYGLTGTAEAFKVWIDDVRVIERPTIQPTGIDISAPVTTVEQDKELELSATLNPAEADPLISWQSRNADIAEVSDGVVTGVGAGEVYIVATSKVNGDIVDSVKVTVLGNIITNGGFESGMEGWVASINGSEVGTTIDVTGENVLSGDTTLLYDHPAEGKKGMWRIALRKGMALDSGMTYDVSAKVKVETTYPDGKRLGVVAKENQGLFSYYWTQPTGTQDIKQSFYWGAMSEDSITLQFQLGYAGEDYGLTGTAEAFKVWIDDVRVIERPTEQPTELSIESEDEIFMVVESEKQVEAEVGPQGVDQFISWSSSDASVAEVSDGLIETVAAGDAYIIASSVVDPSIKDSVHVTVVSNIVTNGDFESGLEGWATAINGSEVGTSGIVVNEKALNGDSTFVLDHPAEGKKGMWRIALRGGVPLDSGYTYVLRAKVKSESDYPDGKRLGVVIKEAQSTFSYYWTAENETLYNLEQLFIWDAASTDSMTLQFQLGYAGEDYGTIDSALAYKVYIDDVELVKRQTVVLEGFDITDGDIELQGASSQQVNYTLTPENGDVNSIEWSSSDEAVVVADDEGNLLPVGEGEAYIIGEAKPWSFKDSVLVKVNEVGLTGIEISGSSSIEAGSVEQMLINWLPSTPINNTITWESSDDKILEIDENGLAKGIAVGEAKITANSDLGGFEAELQVNVFSNVPVTGVEITDGDISIPDQDTKQLSYSITPSDAGVQTVTWESSDEEVATVDANGLVTAQSVGSAEITVKTDDGGFTDKVSVEVLPVSATGISLDKTSFEGYTNEDGGAALIKATIEPQNATNQTIIWSSSDESLATVDDRGFVTFLENGDVTITAVAEDGGFSASADITILTSVKGIRLNSRKETINVGETFQLEGKTNPETASNQKVTWESSDESIVTVDDSGLVTAIAVGEADVTVKSDEGNFFISCKFEVSDPTSVNGLDIKCIEVYPNPVIDILHIKSPEDFKYAIIFNSLGMQVIHKNLCSGSKAEISVSGFPNGVYILRLESVDGSIYSGRFIKK